MRCRLYHHTAPKGEVFTDQEAHDAAIKKGWVPAPWLIEGFGKEKPIKNELIAKDVPSKHISEAPEIKYCECGCGTPVKNRFVQGHSWRAVKKHGNNPDNKSPG